MSSHIKQPELQWHGHYYPRRYWNFFLAGSLITHLFVIALFYNASIYSIVDLIRKKAEPPQMLYVGVVEQERPTPPAVEAEQPVPQPKEAPIASPAPAQNAGGAERQASKGEPTRSPQVKKEAVSEEDLKAAIPVPAGRGEGVTVPVRGAEKASEGAATALQPSLRAVQTRASAPGPAKGVAKGDLRVDEGRQEFSQYSTAGKRLDIPSSQFARKATPEPGDDPSARWFQPKNLNSGGAKLQAGSEGGNAAKSQPRLTTVARAGQVAGAAAGEYRPAASSPGAMQSGPAAPGPPRLARELYGPSPRPGQPGSGAQPGPPAAGPAGIGRGAGTEKQLSVVGTGRGPAASGTGLSDPRIGPRALSEPARPAAAPPTVIITSPADKSEIDAMKEKVLTISGEARGRGVTSVRLQLNGAVYEAPVVGGRFTLKARMDSEDNVLSAEVTDDSGGTARSGLIKFRVANLFPKDMVIKVEYKGEGAHPVLDCRFKLHPLYDKRRLGSVPPKFHIVDGAARGKVEVTSCTPGIYTIGAKCGPGSGGVDALFDVTLYGYDSVRKKTRRYGPCRLPEGAAPSTVRVLMPEGVFWDDNDWFTGVIEGGNGTIKYKEPDGLVWKEER